MSDFGGSVFDLAALDDTDLVAIAAILKRQRKSGLRSADKSLLHPADPEDIDALFTPDCHDFSMVRTANGKKLPLTTEGMALTPSGQVPGVLA